MDRDKCPACKHPERDQEVWKGTSITVKDAAKLNNMTYEDYWHHLKFHGTEVEKVNMEDPHSVLNYLVKKLKSRAETLLVLPVQQNNPALEKIVHQQVRLLKDLVMDIAKLTHQIEESPQVLIQQVMLQQTNLTTAILSDVCPECKAKLMKYLEVNR